MSIYSTRMVSRKTAIAVVLENLGKLTDRALADVLFAVNESEGLDFPLGFGSNFLIASGDEDDFPERRPSAEDRT